MRDWERIALGDAVITGIERGHYDTLVAYGHRLGGPFVAVLDAERGVQVLDVPGSDPVWFAAIGEQIEVTTAGLPPVYLLEDGLPEGKPYGPFEVCDYVDTSDLVRLWPVCGDEDAQHVSLANDGRLRVIDIGGGDPPDGPGLWAVEDPRSASILVGQSSADAFVAGLLRGGQHEPGQQLWVCDYLNGWTHVDLEPAPDAFTDIYSGVWAAVAGHRAGLPLLFREYGTRLETPAVPLEPDHPMVCIFEAAKTEVALALQSAEAGPQLWTGGTGLPWMVEPLPTGRLEAARQTGDKKHLWVLIGGQVWLSDS